MGSGKSNIIIYQLFDYETYSYKSNLISSRNGNMKKCNPFDETTKFDKNFYNKAFIIDECQFLTDDQIDDIYDLHQNGKSIIYLFGLYSTYKGEPFKSILKLMSMTHDIKFLQCFCHLCKKREATYNVKYSDGGKIIFDFDQKENLIDIGGNEKYMSVCYDCYQTQLQKYNAQKRAN